MVRSAMPEPSDPAASDQPPPSRGPSRDPWAAVGYLVAGIGFYGGLGWLADRWLHTGFFVVIGLLLGLALGTYLTIKTFTVPPDAAPGSTSTDVDE